MEYFAYLDAGSGSIILQALIGGILGVIVVARGFTRTAVERVKLAFKKSKSEPSESVAE